MAVARHHWYFETDSAREALEGRRLLERYLARHCGEADLYAAALVYGELLSNVVKHAPENGVRVWLEPEGDRFALCINDGGNGFDDAVFNMTPDDVSESGRGLFIVRRLCERLEYGRLPGSGFMVRAVLPLRRRAAAAG